MSVPDAYDMTTPAMDTEPEPYVLHMRDCLLRELEARERRVKVYEAWYDGNHPLPAPPDRMSRFDDVVAQFRSLSRMGMTNFVSLVPDAPADRLQVIGFRFGEIGNMRNDDDAWRIWQRNDLDADSNLVIHKALVVGNSFMLVWPDKNGLAEITVEHPGQAIVCYQAGSRRKRAAGLKAWCEEDGTKRVVLYLPDDYLPGELGEVYKWTTRGGEHGALERWQPTTDDTRPIANPFGVVPLVEFRANPDLRPACYGGGRSEFAGVLPMQRRINKTVFDRLVTAEFHAFPQRWIIGWTPDDNNEALQASMKHLWSFLGRPDEVQVGAFPQADFTHFLKAVESDVQWMAANTRTPTFYTLGAISNVSGDTLAMLQAGLVAKCKRHSANFGEDFEEVLQLALQAEGNPRASDDSTQVVWQSIEHVTWAEKADAAVKMAAVNVPDEPLWEFLGFTPQEVERFKVYRAEQALYAQPPLPTPAVSVAGRVIPPASAPANVQPA